MNTSKAATKSGSEQVATEVVLDRQQKLIRELHDLLTTYGPTWYTEEIDSRLSKMLAMFRLYRKPRRKAALHCPQVNRHENQTAL
jgi:hypothetical protein